MHFFSKVVLTVFLGLSVAQDIREQKLSNKRNMIGLAGGLLLSIFRTDVTVTEAFSGAAVALCIGAVCWLLKVFKAGDSKLFCVVGAYIGYPMVLPCFFYVLVAGALFGLPLLIVKLLKKKKGFTRMPLAPAIAAGTLFAVYMGNLWTKL